MFLVSRLRCNPLSGSFCTVMQICNECQWRIEGADRGDRCHRAPGMGASNDRVKFFGKVT